MTFHQNPQGAREVTSSFREVGMMMADVRPNFIAKTLTHRSLPRSTRIPCPELLLLLLIRIDYNDDDDDDTRQAYNRVHERV